jgi:hypothetical protein
LIFAFSFEESLITFIGIALVAFVIFLLYKRLVALENGGTEAAGQVERDRKENAEKSGQERKETEQERQQKIQELQSEHITLTTKLLNRSAVLSEERRSLIKARLKEIEDSLSKL